MYYYFFAQIQIDDEEAYQRYLDKAGHVFSEFNGKYLAVDDSSQVLEGSWNYTRAVLIRFSSKKDFEEWYYSAGYQEILKHRLEASHCDTILVKGME